jgi:hypothetical protein
VNARLPAALLLLSAAASALCSAQRFDENSVPASTGLSAVASAPTAEVIVMGRPSQIESDDAIAEIAPVQVMNSGGESLRGVRVSLKSQGQADQLYLDVSQVSQLREEFVGFEAWPEGLSTCEAINVCVFGVARCRPSQDVPQAFCPSLYLTSAGDRGVLLAAAGHSFRFPSTHVSVFVSAIDASLAELRRQKANENTVGQ